MYIKIKDELGAIREYKQSTKFARPGQLIKLTRAVNDTLRKGDIIRAELTGPEGEVIVGGRNGYSIKNEEYITLVMTKFLWFQRKRYYEAKEKAKNGDKVLIQLRSGKYMVLTVTKSTAQGVVAVSSEFTKLMDHGTYIKLIYTEQKLPVDIKPFYSINKTPQAEEYAELINTSIPYGTEHRYPAVYKVKYKNSKDACVEHLLDGNTFSVPLKSLRVVKFTEENTNKVYLTKLVEPVQVETESESSTSPVLLEETLMEHEARIKDLENVLEDMFSRLTGSLYANHRKVKMS